MIQQYKTQILRSNQVQNHFYFERCLITDLFDKMFASLIITSKILHSYSKAKIFS